MTEALPPVPAGYASLAELRSRHADLLKATGPDVLAPDNVRQLSEFISKATQTGRILDAADDRTQAQGLINFWVARLSSAARVAGLEPSVPMFSDTILEAFVTGTIHESADRADTWIATLPKPDQLLARRVLLRLVRLQTGMSIFVPVPTVRAALSDLGQPVDVGRIIDGLASAGVVRVVPAEIAEMDRVLLRSPELMISWKAFAGWQGERAEFRRQAEEWEGAGRRSVGKGLSESEFDEVRSYHDRNSCERAYIEACLNRERHRRELLRGGVVLLAVVLLIVIPLAIYSGIGWRKAAIEEKEVERQRDLATKSAKEAENERALAEAARLEVSRRHRFVRTVQVVRTLAEVGAARTDADLTIALESWKDLIGDILKEEATLAPAHQFFTPLGGKMPILQGKAKLSGSATAASQMAADATLKAGRNPASQQLYATEQWYQFSNGTALEVSHVLRNALLFPIDAIDHDSVEIDLAKIRVTAFQQVRLCCNGILNTVRDKEARPFDAAEPYVREFWLNYWGDMGLVEGGDVATAMANLGRKLKEIESKLPQYAFQEGLTRYLRNVKDRGKQEEAKTRSLELVSLDGAKRDQANRWYRTYSRMLYEEEIKELESLIGSLRKAFDEEEKGPVRPYGQ